MDKSLLRRPTSPANLSRDAERSGWRYIQAAACAFLAFIVLVNWAQVATKVSIWQLLGGRDFVTDASVASSLRPPLFSQKQHPAIDWRASAKLLDPELFEGLPETFDPAYKNPCWEDAKGSRHCLPYFYFLGSFQSGSRDVQEKVLRHPQVAKPTNAQPHFWAEKQSTAQYVSIYDAAVPHIQSNPGLHVTGDFSASNFAGYWAMQARMHTESLRGKAACFATCKAAAREGRTECAADMCYQVGQNADRAAAEGAGLDYEQMQTQLLMRGVYTDAQGVHRPPKFIVSLRNPRDRLHSSYWSYGHYWERYGGRGAEGFEAFVTEQIQGFRKCTEEKGRDVFHCVIYFESLSQALEDVFFHCDQLLRGMYSIWLHLWFSFFPREQFLLLRSEDYFANPRRVLSQVFSHLELTEPTESEWDHILASGSIHAAAAGKDMLPGAQSAVDALYSPFNRDLALMLGDDKWLWAD